MPKVIGYTLQDPTIASITGVAFSRQSTGQPGVVEFPVTVAYELVDGDDVVRQSGSIGFSATPQEITSLTLPQLLTAKGTLAAIKAQEGYDS